MCKHQSPHFLLSVALFVLISAMLACNFGAPGQAQSDPTLTALSAAVQMTATAAAVESRTEGNKLATAEAKATERSIEIQATQTASSSGQSESQLATATVAAPVLAELPRYLVDPAAGKVAWLHEPVTIDVTGYQQYGFANDHMQVVARDFVLAADITWDTQYGSSGCGFMFRSNGDQNKPDQYMLIATRLGNGHVIFTAVSDGELANVQDFYAGQVDRTFQWQNQTTNRLAVVGKGTIIEIYTNGVKLGVVDVTQPPKQPQLPAKPALPLDQTNSDEMKKYQNQLKEYQDMVDQVQSNYKVAVKNFETKEAIFDEGFVAMIALSESGHTICKFDNAWLWLIE